ncbi:MAG TPA: DedA family protein [Terracidiphilus sp.]|jgi:membrane protein DedA with SNARE-associated domain
MNERIISLLVHFVTHVIDMGGYAGIVALMGINSACIPLPSEIIMPFSGVLTIFHHNGLDQLIAPGRFGGGNVWLGLVCVATAGMVGCNLGSAFSYWIGAKGGRPLVVRYGKWVLMSHHDLDRMTRFFDKYGSITVLLARMMPVVQTFIAFPAGIARMPRVRFHIYTSVGAWIWYLCLAYAGMRLGNAWNTDPRFQEWFHRFHLAVEIALLAGLLWFVWSHLRRARQVEAS